MSEKLVNLRDPDTGEIGSLPASQVPAALAQGFEQPSGQEVTQYFKEQDYGTPGQQAIAGLEGAASGLSFGLSTGIERAMGASKEGIQARREVNPGTHMAGEMAGLAIGSLYGTGEAAALEGAGNLVARGAAKILPEAFAVNKIGSTAARLAAENALFQGGDEVSKMFAGDPNQSIGSAMADIGLAGVIGGGTGAVLGGVSPLWKATAGKQVESFMNAIRSKAGGIDNVISQPVKNAMETSGLEFAPEIKAALSDDPHLQNVAKTLEQSDTTRSGLEYQETVKNARKELSEAAANAFGRDTATLETLDQPSKAVAGKEVGNAIADEIEAKVTPLAKEFEELKGKVGNVELPAETVIETQTTKPGQLGEPIATVQKSTVPGLTSQIGEELATLADRNKWVMGDGTSGAELYEFTTKRLSKVKDIDGLNGLVKRIEDRAKQLAAIDNKTPLHEASQIKRILRDAEAKVIESKLGEQGAELVDRFRAVRKAYGEAADLVSQVSDQIGVRSSTSGYAKALREMAHMDGEALLRRIAGSGNASGLRLLEEQFPKAAEAFKRYHLDDILHTAASKAKGEAPLNVAALMRKVNGLSPEMRAFLVTPEAAQRLDAVNVLLEKMNSAPHNFSNTARTLDKLNEYVPGGAVAIIGALTGHGVAGAVLGTAAKYLTKDIPDALRLATLKFLGSPQAMDAGAFKAMTDLATSVLRGEAAISKGARAVLRPGASADNFKKISDSNRDKLDKQLLAYQENPAKLMELGGELGHYMPDHTSTAAAVASNAITYLNSLRPDTMKKMPLDRKLPPDPVKKAQFERALDIAQSPLIVFDAVKNGTVTKHDLVTLQNVAPGLYQRMREKLQSEMLSHASEDAEIPYKTRLGVAMFLGQPLDTTMTPQSIMAAQPQGQAQAPQMAQAAPSKQGMHKLGKLPGMAADASQSREMARAKHLA